MVFERCTSCNAPLAEEGWTKFPCPVCGITICRCERCRHQSIEYACTCGFRGP